MRCDVVTEMESSWAVKDMSSANFVAADSLRDTVIVFASETRRRGQDNACLWCSWVRIGDFGVIMVTAIEVSLRDACQCTRQARPATLFPPLKWKQAIPHSQAYVASFFSGTLELAC